jgi:hypothetical protein
MRRDDCETVRVGFVDVTVLCLVLIVMRDGFMGKLIEKTNAEGRLLI